MLVVGLTGGIASGKSFVSSIFSRLGAHIIDADRIVRELLEPGKPVWQEISVHFSNSVMTPDGRIDRKKLGDIVFTDARERAWLNGCLHPRVFEEYREQVKRLGSHDQNLIVIFDAALLIETGYYQSMDKLVLVYCHPEQQLSRLMERDGIGPDQALARIKSQMPISEKRQHADFIIENTGTRVETEHQTRTVFTNLKEIERGIK